MSKDSPAMQESAASPPLWAVVPAAGAGTRLPSAYPKQYLEIKGRCILQRAIDTLLAMDVLQGVVVVLSESDTLWGQLEAAKHPLVVTTIGGDSRAESVVAGLKMVHEKAQDDTAMVLVHDAARALTAASDIARLIEQVLQAPEHGGLLATKVQDTLKRSANESKNDAYATQKIESTVSREGLWHAQTPQMFQVRLLLDALTENQAAILRGDITDEACAMETAGYSPALVEALKANFKITHSRDLDMALALVELSERES